jgi:hypothetical protein
MKFVIKFYNSAKTSTLTFHFWPSLEYMETILHRGIQLSFLWFSLFVGRMDQTTIEAMTDELNTFFSKKKK